MSRARRRGFMVHYVTVDRAVEYTTHIRNIGGNTIRWQLNGNFGAKGTSVDLTTEQGYYTWLAGHLSIIDQSITQEPELFKDVKIIIDLHNTYRAGSMFRNGWLSRRAGRKVFLDSWKVIAERFKGRPQILAYDLVNEPRYTLHGRYHNFCLLYTSPSPRDATLSRMPSSA